MRPGLQLQNFRAALPLYGTTHLPVPLLANAIRGFVVTMGWGAALLTPRNLRQHARLIPLHFQSPV